MPHRLLGREMLAGTQTQASTWTTHRWAEAHGQSGAQATQRCAYRQTYTGMLAEIKALGSDRKAVFIQNHIKIASARNTFITDYTTTCFWVFQTLVLAPLYFC